MAGAAQKEMAFNAFEWHVERDFSEAEARTSKVQRGHNNDADAILHLLGDIHEVQVIPARIIKGSKAVTYELCDLLIHTKQPALVLSVPTTTPFLDIAYCLWPILDSCRPSVPASAG